MLNSGWLADPESEGSAARGPKDAPSDAKHPGQRGLASWPLAAAAMRLVGPQGRGQAGL